MIAHTLNLFCCVIIFSRDKTRLNEIISENHINILLQCANLVEDSSCILITAENMEGKLPNLIIVY